jgi:protein-disulfide isomerase
MAKLRENAEVTIDLEPPRIMVATTGPSRGSKDAPITIVEFSDYQCPFCGRAEPVMEDVLSRYPGQVRLVFRHLPLGFHKNARPAAEASVCAENQGRFWEYHALLFQNQKALGAEALEKYAVDAGLDVEDFKTCLTDEPTRARVEEDLREAREAGASGTPAFFVNGIPLSGALPAEAFVKIIDEELARLAAEDDSTS